MAFCEKMNRPCTCGKLTIYDQTGRIQERNKGTGCLTDKEVRSFVALLMGEYRRRFP